MQIHVTQQVQQISINATQSGQSVSIRPALLINGEENAGPTYESAILSRILAPEIVAGEYAFNINNSRAFRLELTEETELHMPVLANNTNVIFSVIVSGDFPLTINNATATANSQPYNGNAVNRLLFDCFKIDNVQTNYVTIQNLT